MLLFVERVKELMEEKKMSQKQLSELSNISEASICRYLRGNCNVRLDIIANLAKALDVNESYLIGETNKQESKNFKLQVRDILARNRNVITDQDKMDIINMLYGKYDDK